MTRSSFRVGACLVMTLMMTMIGGAASSARAEITVFPFVGAAFGGNVDDGKIVYGLAFGLRGDRSAFGFELDLGLAPDFLRETAIDDSSVTTLMANLLLTAPRDGSRLYASGGIGIVKARVKSVGHLFDLDSNEFGLNAGAGAIVFLGSRVGLRGDLRYFRALTDPEPDDEFDVGLGDLDFWRAIAGVVLKF